MKKLFLSLIMIPSLVFGSATRTSDADTLTSSDKSKIYTLPAATDTFLGRASTDTLTNKSISGSTNTITNISLTSGVTGTLPIGNGGTGQTTKAPAFNALSPLTTKADLIVHDGTNNVRQGVGSDGTCLVADSAQTNGIKWASCTGSSTPPLSVVSKTATYNATTSDDVILVSGGTFPINLYASATNNGRMIRIKKTDSSFSNIITIDANGSETIDGKLTRTLNTQNEEWTLICDGSNWQVFSHKIPSIFTSTTNTITATTTNPTKGATPSPDLVWYDRVGKKLVVRIEYKQTNAGSGGSGDYLFTVPGSLSIDSAAVTFFSTIVGFPAASLNTNKIGSFFASDNSTDEVGAIVAYDATHVRMIGINITPQAGAISSSKYALSNTNLVYTATYEAQIDGWDD